MQLMKGCCQKGHYRQQDQCGIQAEGKPDLTTWVSAKWLNNYRRNKCFIQQHNLDAAPVILSHLFFFQVFFYKTRQDSFLGHTRLFEDLCVFPIVCPKCLKVLLKPLSRHETIYFFFLKGKQKIFHIILISCTILIILNSDTSLPMTWSG